ncbi:MAG: hypothetical protein U0350_17035 [Caldilineaceae bacterium]
MELRPRKMQPPPLEHRHAVIGNLAHHLVAEVEPFIRAFNGNLRWSRISAVNRINRRSASNNSGKVTVDHRTDLQHLFGGFGQPLNAPKIISCTRRLRCNFHAWSDSVTQMLTN